MIVIVSSCRQNCVSKNKGLVEATQLNHILRSTYLAKRETASKSMCFEQYPPCNSCTCCIIRIWLQHVYNESVTRLSLSLLHLSLVCDSSLVRLLSYYFCTCKSFVAWHPICYLQSIVCLLHILRLTDIHLLRP